MQRSIQCSTLLFAFTLATLADAQEMPNLPKAEKEHQWLRQFAGQWQTESETMMGEDQPPMKSTGTMSSRMLGEFWVVSDYVGKMPGMTVKGVQTIGYDVEKREYVGTWIDSVMNHMWRYEGKVDESGKTLVLAAEGPNCMEGGKLTKYRDAYTFKSKDHIVVRSSMQREDGSWLEFMTGNFRRAQ